MEAKILNKVSLFLFFLLIFAATVPGTAQRNSNNNHQDIRRGGNQMNSNRVTNHTRFAYHGTTIRNGNRNIGRANVNLNVTTRGWRSATCAPSIRTKAVRPLRSSQVVRVLPSNAMKFQAGGRNYFHARGTFYIYTNYGYRVTQAPLGAIVSHLPNQAIEVYYDRNIYYQVGNIMLAPVMSRRGGVVYELVGFV